MKMTDELERHAQVYAGTDYREHKSITVEVMSERADEVWSVDAFIEILNKIPAEYRETGKVELEDDYDCGSSLRVTYQRPETDEEVADRVHRALDYAHQKVEKERLEYERLKQKFES